jgi:hypothetical protein
MRIRTSLITLAVMAMTVLPAAAEAARAEQSPVVASITLTEPSTTPDSVSTLTATTEHVMSWGNSASGNAQQVKGHVATFASTVATNDASFNHAPAIAEAHQTQARAAEAAIGTIIDSYPDGTVFSVSVSASIGGDGGSSGFVNIGYSVSVPVSESTT